MSNDTTTESVNNNAAVIERLRLLTDFMQNHATQLPKLGHISQSESGDFTAIFLYHRNGAGFNTFLDTLDRDSYSIRVLNGRCIVTIVTDNRLTIKVSVAADTIDERTIDTEMRPVPVATCGGAQ